MRTRGALDTEKAATGCIFLYLNGRLAFAIILDGEVNLQGSDVPTTLSNASHSSALYISTRNIGQEKLT